jgi:hypothetical protein
LSCIVELKVELNARLCGMLRYTLASVTAIRVGGLVSLTMIIAGYESFKCPALLFLTEY